jgi:hypothetical protein
MQNPAAVLTRKDFDTAYRKKQQQTISSLREQVELLRRDRAAAMRGIQITCRAGIEDAKRRGARLRRWAMSTVEKAEGECAAAKSEIEASSVPEAEKAKKLLREERDLQAHLRRWEKRSAQKKTKKRSARETQQESDEDVEREIEPHLIPLWNKVKKSIKAKPNMSRYEAFLHYAEASPDEAVAAIEEAVPTDSEFEAAQRAYYEQEQRAANPARAPRKPAFLRTGASPTPGEVIERRLATKRAARLAAGNAGRAQHPELTDLLTFTSTRDNGHTHRVHVSEADLATTKRITYTTSRDMDHTHEVTLAPCDLHGIARGDEEVHAVTTIDFGHAHEFVIRGRQENPASDDGKVVQNVMQTEVRLVTSEIGGPIPRQYRTTRRSGVMDARVTIQGETNLTEGWVRYDGPLGAWNAKLGRGVHVGKPARTTDTSAAVFAAREHPGVERDESGAYVRRGNPAEEKRRANPAKKSQRGDGVMIKGDEVSFIMVGKGTPDEREKKGYRKRISFGKGPQDYLTDTVLVHDPSGVSYRQCDVYIVKRLKNASRTKECNAEPDSKTKDYYPGVEIDCDVPLEKPSGPWQRVGQIDGIRYRRWWDEHGNGNYRFVPFEHPFDPPVVLFKCGGAFRVRLPDGCILDERGFVHP